MQSPFLGLFAAFGLMKPWNIDIERYQNSGSSLQMRKQKCWNWNLFYLDLFNHTIYNIFFLMIYDIFPSPSKHIKNLEKQFVQLDAEMNPKALGVSLFPPPQDSQDGSPAEADAEGAAASEPPAPAKAAPKGSPAAAPTTAVARDYTRDMAQLGWWRYMAMGATSAVFDVFFLIEGSLEVKLPTIWTVETQRWEESEEKRSEERRSEEKESEERRCRCAKR